MNLVIQEDVDNDSLYLCFVPSALEAAAVAKSVRVSDDVTVDLDADGRLIGLDIMNASAVLPGDRSELRLDCLLGVKEAASLAGVQKSNFVRDYANNPAFPKPVTELATGRIWLRSQVEAYLKTRRASAKLRSASARVAS